MVTRHLSNNGVASMSPSRNVGRKRAKPKQSSWFQSLTPSTLIKFLASLGVITIVADSYFMWNKSARKNAMRDNTSGTDNKQPHNPSTLISSSSSLLSQLRVSKSVNIPKEHSFNFAKEDTLPKLQKRNNNFANADSPHGYGKEPILQVFKDAGIPLPLNETVMEMLPTWEQIVQLFGPHPVVGGLDTCEAFKEQVPAVERMLGSAGMFNSGTNLVTHLLKNNCKIPERVAKYGEDASREAHGMRWQVPWGKHSPAKFKVEHSTEKAKAINKEWIMPVVTIRHPYSWTRSMCKNSYTARWPHRKQCPNLKEGGEWNEVTTRFAEGRVETYKSLAHLWNDWYGMYINAAKYPRLIVRMEDLVFHAQETTTIVCECVGGAMRKDRPFTYVIDSAKADSPGHDKSTGFVQAWIKYSKPMPPRGGLRSDDFQFMVEALDPEIMKQFDYKHPVPAGAAKDQDGGGEEHGEVEHVGGNEAAEHEPRYGKAGPGEEYEA